MNDFEPLSWASATLIAAGDSAFPRRAHVLANGHVVTPWRYINLYPKDQADWLKHVEQRHCKYELQVVDEDGGVVATAELNSNAPPFAHQTRDLAALYARDDDDLADAAAAKGIEVAAISLADRAPREGETLDVTGHTIADDGDYGRILLPVLVEARLACITDRQTFLETACPLEQGMCGAPAIFQDDATCAGIIDGIVSPVVGEDAPEIRRHLAGAASLIPADELLEFLSFAEIDPALKRALTTSG